MENRILLHSNAFVHLKQYRSQCSIGNGTIFSYGPDEANEMPMIVNDILDRHKDFLLGKDYSLLIQVDYSKNNRYINKKFYIEFKNPKDAFTFSFLML